MGRMTDQNNLKASDYMVDRKFTEYIDYVKDASLDNIQNCMKRNLAYIRSLQRAGL
jgi:hypothetical protein